jgi:tRNA (cmo5U34)-methyltransferase
MVHLQIQAILKTHLPEHANVLIVGCGTGYELSYLLAQHPTWSFTAVDPSLTMIEKAQQLLSETNRDLTRVHFVHGDTTALQESAQFDAALAILVAHFIPSHIGKVSGCTID